MYLLCAFWWLCGCVCVWFVSVHNGSLGGGYIPVTGRWGVLCDGVRPFGLGAKLEGQSLSLDHPQKLLPGASSSSYRLCYKSAQVTRGPRPQPLLVLPGPERQFASPYLLSVLFCFGDLQESLRFHSTALPLCCLGVPALVL